MQSNDVNPLIEMIYSDTILLDVEVKDWEEAVRVSGELLVKTGFVEERYIDAMIDTVKSIGPLCGYRSRSGPAACPTGRWG